VNGINVIIEGGGGYREPMECMCGGKGSGRAGGGGGGGRMMEIIMVSNGEGGERNQRS
jgi:hypothetical protein